MWPKSLYHWEISRLTRYLAMKTFNSRICRHVNSLCDYIETYDGHSVPINDTVSRFTFDVLGDVLFSRDYSLLDNKGWHPYLDHREDVLPILGLVNDTTWLAHMMFSLAPFWNRVKDWFFMVSFSESQMMRRLEVSSCFL